LTRCGSAQTRTDYTVTDIQPFSEKLLLILPKRLTLPLRMTRMKDKIRQPVYVSYTLAECAFYELEF
jgi:hypothetical protein